MTGKTRDGADGKKINTQTREPTALQRNRNSVTTVVCAVGESTEDWLQHCAATDLQVATTTVDSCNQQGFLTLLHVVQKFKLFANHFLRRTRT